MKRIQQVQKLCTEYHGGQRSALYQFASSGIFVPENILHYLKELQTCLESEYFLYPQPVSKKEQNRLNSAIRYFEKEAKKAGITVVWSKHPIYGYLIPYIIENKQNVNVLTLKLLI